jgi:high-affinity iron transporter
MLVSNALIGLREGLEATLVVVILVAFLVRTGRTWALRHLWTGVAVAVALSVALGAVLTLGTRELDDDAQELIGGAASVVAVGFVTWMVFWMKRASRTISGELRDSMDRAVSVGPVAIMLVGFLGVGREGLETAVFFFATAEAAGSGDATPLLGWAVGIGAATVLGYLVYQGAVRINLGSFFRWTGIALVVVAAGILGYGLHDLQEGGALPGVATLAFDVSGTVAPTSPAGVLLKALFGFTPETTALQGLAWVLYVAVVLTMFLRPSRPGVPVAAEREPQRTA